VRQPDDLPVDAVLGRLCIERGMSVAVLGDDGGSFVLPIASAVGPSGSVNAIHDRPEVLATLRAHLPEDAPVVLHQAGLADTPLARSSQDFVLVATAWQNLRDPRAAVDEFARILRPDAFLVILDSCAKEPPCCTARSRAIAPVVEQLNHRGWTAIGSVPLAQSVLVVARRPEI
jgi:ubiquinone/menaquinone biosynthesis C-methylase UbiE